MARTPISFCHFPANGWREACFNSCVYEALLIDSTKRYATRQVWQACGPPFQSTAAPWGSYQESKKHEEKFMPQGKDGSFASFLSPSCDPQPRRVQLKWIHRVTPSAWTPVRLPARDMGPTYECPARDANRNAGFRAGLISFDRAVIRWNKWYDLRHEPVKEPKLG